MATYLQNSTDVFPEIDYAAPNYQLMSTALGALTQRYNAGFDKLRTMYSSLLNSPVTNPETEKMRQMWFKKNNEQLKQYAHVDLAVSSNVSSAMSSFDPLVENKSFVSDMNYTRQYQQQAAQINQLKTSTDEKQRKLYNPLMEEYVMRGMQQLKQAKFDDIPNHSVRNYLAIEDPMSYLNAQAKEQGLKIVQESGSGMYILKDTNGNGAKKEFGEWASNLLGSGQYGEYYNRAASVTVDKQVDAILKNAPGLTRDQALQEIGKQALPSIYKTHEDYANSIKYNIAQIDKMKNTMINRYGTKVPPDVAQSLVPYAQRRKELQNQLDDLNKRPEAFAEAVQDVVQNYVRNPYGYTANVLRSSDSKRWASTYADVHAEHEIRPDQVKLEMYQQQQQNMRQQRQFDHDLKKAYLEHTYRKAEKEYEKTLENSGTLTEGLPEVATENKSAVEMFEKDITTKVGESSALMTHRDVLAVALNLPTEGNKVSGKIPGGTLGTLQSAIREAELSYFRNIPLSAQSKAILNSFTQQIDGQNFKNFDQIQQIIRREIKENSEHPLSKSATDNLSQGMRKLTDANTLFVKEQQTLKAHANAYPDAIKYENGRWIRVGNHYSDPVLNQIVPDKQKYANVAGTTLPSLTYNIGEKSNMTHVTRAAQQAQNIGYYDSTGKFVEFDPEDAQVVKNTLGKMGTLNLKESVDANITITPGDRYKGQDMVRVTIPLKRSGEKGKLAIGSYGLPSNVVDKAGQANSITLMIPAANAGKLGLNAKLMKKADGSIVSQDDPNGYIINRAQSSAEENPFASELMRLNEGAKSVPFPEYMSVNGQHGAFSMSDGQVYITFYDDNGNVISEEPTHVTTITPQTANQLEAAALQYVNDKKNAKAAYHANVRQQNRSNVKADWVDINSIY